MVTRIQPAVSDPDAARSLGSLLSRLPDSEPVPPAVDSTQLLDTLAQLADESMGALPEVVLVHELIGPLPALELIREIALRFPAVGVVLITRDTSPPLYSAAMDAGARGVLGLPLSFDDLAARVGAAAAWATGVRRHLGGGGAGASGDAASAGGTVVAVTGAKGGVGTTLTAVQLALAAQASGRGTALVDMDLQSGDVASYLDVQFRRSAADLAGIDDISPRVLQDAVFTHESGLGLLLAPGEGERGEEVDDRASRQIVTALRGRYEVVVVDCGTQLNAANAAAIEMADRAVLLTTPDVVAVRAAKRMVRMWDRLQIRKAEEAITLVNRTSRHSEIQPALVARIVGTPVARSTVPANFKELQTAVDAGRMQDLDSKGSVKQALWGFAGELGLVAPPEPAQGGGKLGKGVRGGRGTARQGKQPAPGAPATQALPAGGTGAGGGMGAAGGAGGNRQALPPGAAGPTGGMRGGSVNDPAGGGRYGPGPDPGAGSFHARPRGAGAGGGVRGGIGGGPEDEGDDEASVWGERGAVTVEFVGMAPIVLVVLAILWQCVLIGYTFSLAGNAADEAARAATAAAAVGDPQGACRAAATEHLPAKWREDSNVSCRLSGHLWKADVDLGTPVLIPGAGHLPFTVGGRAGAAEEG